MYYSFNIKKESHFLIHQQKAGNNFMYKCQPGFTLQKMQNKYYLLPYGQQIADQKRGILLNDTGVFLWNAIKSEKCGEPDQLTKKLMENYQLDESHFSQLLHDVNDYLYFLTSMGILAEELHIPPQQPVYTMQIAGIPIHLYGKKEFFSPYFQPFFINNIKKAEQHIEIVTTPPQSHYYETSLIQNEEITIFENSDRYVILFPSMDNIYEAYMTKDGSYVRIHCHPEITDSNVENIFHAIRLFFLFIAQKKGLFALHSASILYKHKAWLFSGHSGMGKSTHTALWHDLFHTPYLNGDLNLIGLKNEKLTVFGIPWCGTSQIFTTKQYELGGIILLGRDKENDRFEPLSLSDKTLRISQRMISPTWKKSQLLSNLEFSETIAEAVPIYHLLCTKNPTAAITMKHAIDQLEENNEK